jgi:hypothetical protein
LAGADRGGGERRQFEYEADVQGGLGRHGKLIGHMAIVFNTPLPAVWFHTSLAVTSSGPAVKRWNGMLRLPQGCASLMCLVFRWFPRPSRANKEGKAGLSP